MRGVAIVAAIFILVVLSALGAFIVSISTTQQVGSTLDLQGVRAYQGARAGLEWGLYQAQAAGNCPGTLTVLSANATGSTNSFAPPSAASSLAGVTITVICTKITDGNSGPTVYSLTATACNQPLSGWSASTVACPNTSNATSLYVERQLTVSF